MEEKEIIKKKVLCIASKADLQCQLGVKFVEEEKRNSFRFRQIFADENGVLYVYSVKRSGTFYQDVESLSLGMLLRVYDRIVILLDCTSCTLYQCLYPGQSTTRVGNSGILRGLFSKDSQNRSTEGRVEDIEVVLLHRRNNPEKTILENIEKTRKTKQEDGTIVEHKLTMIDKNNSKILLDILGLPENFALYENRPSTTIEVIPEESNSLEQPETSTPSKDYVKGFIALMFIMLLTGFFYYSRSHPLLEDSKDTNTTIDNNVSVLHSGICIPNGSHFFVEADSCEEEIWIPQCFKNETIFSVGKFEESVSLQYDYVVSLRDKNSLLENKLSVCLEENEKFKREKKEMSDLEIVLKNENESEIVENILKSLSDNVTESYNKISDPHSKLIDRKYRKANNETIKINEEKEYIDSIKEYSKRKEKYDKFVRKTWEIDKFLIRGLVPPDIWEKLKKE